MRTISRILVPTDFSPLAQPAFDQAADLARRYAASVVVLHVAQVPTLLTPGVLFREGLLTNQDAQIERQLADAREAMRLRGIGRITTKSMIGDPAAAILHEIDALGIDLVVMGSHGRTGWRHAIMGSIAERVVREARCPVLIVRPPNREPGKSAEAPHGQPAG
jgi:nucleotide-binding universal stress UspA family protein